MACGSKARRRPSASGRRGTGGGARRRRTPADTAGQSTWPRRQRDGRPRHARGISRSRRTGSQRHGHGNGRFAGRSTRRERFAGNEFGHVHECCADLDVVGKPDVLRGAVAVGFSFAGRCRHIHADRHDGQLGAGHRHAAPGRASASRRQQREFTPALRSQDGHIRSHGAGAQRRQLRHGDSPGRRPRPLYGRQRPELIVRLAQIYDPATGKFTATGSMTVSRMSHAATLLADGRVLITGGSTFSGGSAARPQFEAMAYRPGAGAVGQIPAMTGPAMLASAEVYDPATGKFTATGSMTMRRATHSATLLADGRVLVAGGGNEGNSAVGSASCTTPRRASSAPQAPCSWLSTPRSRCSSPTAGSCSRQATTVAGRSHRWRCTTRRPGYSRRAGSTEIRGGFGSPALLHDGRVLFVGGFDITAGKSGYLASCEVYDPATGQLSATGSMSTARLAGFVATLSDGRVLVAGGVNSAPDWLSSAELYQP